MAKVLKEELKNIKTNVFNYKNEKFDVKRKPKVVFKKKNAINFLTKEERHTFIKYLDSLMKLAPKKGEKGKVHKQKL